MSVDGSWGVWGAWGACSVTCGAGQRSRSRACDSPAPSNGGSPCPGLADQTEACNTHTCPGDRLGDFMSFSGFVHAFAHLLGPRVEAFFIFRTEFNHIVWMGSYTEVKSM